MDTFTPEQMLAMATKFHLWPPEPKEGGVRLNHFHIGVEYRGHGHWAIMRDNCAYDKMIDEFVDEPLPSSRDDKYYDNCRYLVLSEALTKAQEIAALYAAAWAEYLEQRDKPGGNRWFQPQVKP